MDSHRVTKRDELQLCWKPYSSCHDRLYLILSGASIKRTRHENVMSIVMGSGLKSCPGYESGGGAQCETGQTW